MNLSTNKAIRFAYQTREDQVQHIRENQDKTKGYFLGKFECSPAQLDKLIKMAGVKVLDSRISPKFAHRTHEKGLKGN